MHGVEPLFELLDKQRCDYRVHHVGTSLHVHVDAPQAFAALRDSLREQFALESLDSPQRTAVSGVSFLVNDHEDWRAADYVFRGRADDRDVVIVVEAKVPRADTTGAAVGYRDDFARWAEDQGQAIRERQWDRIDTENLAEEIEDLSKSLHRELRSRLRVLIMHRLKWDFQPEQRSSSWVATMREQQAQIEDLLDESPSLRNALDGYARRGYEAARDLAAAETEYAPDRFPAELPYTVADLLATRVGLNEES